MRNLLLPLACLVFAWAGAMIGQGTGITISGITYTATNCSQTPLPPNIECITTFDSTGQHFYALSVQSGGALTGGCAIPCLSGKIHDLYAVINGQAFPVGALDATGNIISYAPSPDPATLAALQAQAAQSGHASAQNPGRRQVILAVDDTGAFVGMSYANMTPAPNPPPAPTNGTFIAFEDGTWYNPFH